jgi:3-hydroxy-9,10-secoandrosta-1,3,5(10)-triene-9,17-dione monooxygenase
MSDAAVSEAEAGAKSAAAIRLELLAAAEALVPVLRGRSAKAEALRHCPEETVADYAAAGLLRMCTPARWGGYELPWDVLCEVSRVLARGCGSQAWVGNIYNDHCQLLGQFEPEAQADVWGKDRGARMSAAVEPTGKGRPVPGGAMYAGRHRYSSGIDHAHWLLCGGHLLAEGKAPQQCYFLVPKSQVSVIDDWHVIGLAGTGSKSFEVKETFVPSHRILDADASNEGTAPGAAVNHAALYRMPRHDIAGTGFAAIAVGIAEGFLDEYVSYTKSRTSRGLAIAEQMGTQIGAGSSAAELIAASRLVLGATREAMAVLERGQRLDMAQRRKTRLSASYATQLSLTAAQRLFNAAGGRALFLDSAMQRQIRDLYAVAAHRGLAWDSSTANYGAMLLGTAP